MNVSKQTIIKSTKFNLEMILRTYDDGSTAIESNLMDDIEDDEENPDVELRAAYDTIESLVLAQYSAGIKVGSPAYGLGLDTALESIINHLT